MPQLITLRLWPHPNSGEPRIYVNFDNARDISVRVYITKLDMRDGAWRINVQDCASLVEYSNMIEAVYLAFEAQFGTQRLASMTWNDLLTAANVSSTNPARVPDSPPQQIAGDRF